MFMRSHARAEHGGEDFLEAHFATINMMRMQEQSEEEIERANQAFASIVWGTQPANVTLCRRRSALRMPSARVEWSFCSTRLA